MRVDWAGLISFSGALFLLVFALVQGNNKGWTSTEILSMLIGAFVLLVAFFVVEVMQERPMLDLSLFRRPAFCGASIVAFAVSASIFSMFLYLVLYIQDVLGYSPLQAGLRFLPVTLLSFVVAPIAGRLTVKVPVRALLGTGLLLVGAGLIAMTAINATSGWTTLIPGFLLTGAGIGMINPPLASTAIGVVPPERAGMASGINSTFRQVGIATGIAGLGAIFQHQVIEHTTAPCRPADTSTKSSPEPTGSSGQLLQSGGVPQLIHTLAPAARSSLNHAYRLGFTQALTDILIVAAIVALVGSALAYF